MPSWETPRDVADLRPNTLWWRNSDVALIKRVDLLDTVRVQVQFLNDMRFKRVVEATILMTDWLPQPRIDLAWLNMGSLWRRIDYKAGKLSREKFTLNQVRNGHVSLFSGTPGNYKEVFNRWMGSKILSFTLNYVRVWPTPFPQSPDVPTPIKRERKRRPRPVATSRWERLNEDLFGDP